MASESSSQVWRGGPGVARGIDGRNGAARYPMDCALTILDSFGNDSSFCNRGVRDSDIEGPI